MIEKPPFYLLCGHGAASGPVLVIRYGAFMPEKYPADLVGGSLHIKHHSHTLTLPGVRSFKLQDNRAGKIAVPQVGKIVVLSDIDHTPKILDEAAVRVVSGRLVKKAPAVRIGIEHDLHGVNDRGFTAPGMSGKEIDSLMKGQSLVPDIMPVVQADPGQCLKPLTRHLPHLLLCMSQSKPSRHPLTGPH